MRIDFINNVEYALKEELPDIKDLSDYLSMEDEVPVISKLFDDANKVTEKNNSAIEKVTDSVSEKPMIFNICILGVIVVLALVVVFVLRAKKKRETPYNNSEN